MYQYYGKCIDIMVDISILCRNSSPLPKRRICVIILLHRMAHCYDSSYNSHRPPVNYDLPNDTASGCDCGVSPLARPWVQRLPWYSSADIRFLWDKAAVLGDTIKRTVCMLCSFEGRSTRWFKYDRDWFVCKQAALRSSCATFREWSHNLHPPSCSG